MARRRLAGAREIARALDDGTPIGLLLVGEPPRSREIESLIVRARALEVPVLEESARELRRMGGGEGAGDGGVLALLGPAPTRDLDEMMRGDGIVFALSGLRYPRNVGYILRACEVAGGAGVVLDTDWGEAQRTEAFRVGMRAERFLPVLEGRAEGALESARRAGRRVLAVETSGRVAPWETDLSGSPTILVGGEATGLPARLLEAADEVVRIPTAGFIPSYNVQAAVGVVLGEWLRQNA